MKFNFSISDSALSDWFKDVDARVQFGLKFGKSRGFVQTGASVVVVTGWKQGSGFTNTLRIVYVEPDFIDSDRSRSIVTDSDSNESIF